MNDDRTVRLVIAAQYGNTPAIAELLELYGTMIYTVVRNLLYPRPDIDDVYQEACVQAFTSIQTLREPERFGGWFKRIAIGKAVDHLRKPNSLPQTDISNIPSAQDLAQEVANQGEYVVVRKAVAELPLHYKEVIVLYYWSDCSYAEIAETLDIPLGTVMSRLHKAKRLLTVKLKPLQRKEGELCGYRD